MQHRPFSQQRPRVDWLLAGSIGLVALLVLFLALVPGIVVRSVLRRDSLLAQRIDPMASSAAALAGLVVDQEASERGYIITADPSFLGPYKGSSAQLTSLWPVAETQARAVGGRAPALLAAMRRSAAAWQTQAAEAEITDVGSGYQQDAASAVASGRSQLLFDQFRRDSEALSAYLGQIRATQTSARDSDLSRLDTVENVLVGLGLLALGLLVYAGARYIALLRRVVLTESEARFRNIVETANEGVWLLDRQARTLVANHRMAELLGVESENLARASILDFCFADDRAEAERHLLQNVHGRSEQFDFRLRRTDGRPLLVLACTSPVRDAAGSVIGALGMFSDITARVQTEAERNELLHRLQEAWDAAETARHRLSLLAAASHRLAEAGNDLQAVLDTAAKETADALGDGCVLRLASSPDGVVLTSAAYHRDPAQRATLLRASGGVPGKVDPTSAEAMRMGRTVLVSAPPGDTAAPPAGQQPPASGDGAQRQSRLVAPIQAGNRALGTLEVFRTTDGQPFTSDDELLLRDLSERIGLAIENAGLYRDAVEALGTRDEFLSAITHDLRSPLTSVRGFTQLMLRRLERNDAADPQRLRSWLTTIEKSSERMSAMLNELLDLAQLRDGRPLHLNPSRVDLVALTRQLADEQQSEGRHRVVIETPEGGVSGFWDPIRLARVITNLLSNAVKYSPSGGTVTVSVQPCYLDGAGEAWAEFRVRDEGLGIPPEDLSHIFERFHRGTNVGVIGGLGIGLAAARQIVEQHGGTLTVESELGRGSVFIMRLPLAGPGQPDSEPDPRADPQ